MKQLLLLTILFMAITGYSQTTTLIDTSTQAIQQQAIKDAKKHYSPLKPYGVTFVTSTLGSGVLGLIPAIMYEKSTPKPIDLRLPNAALYDSNPIYAMAYMKQAKKTRRTYVWIAWCSGTVLNACAVSSIIVLTH